MNYRRQWGPSNYSSGFIARDDLAAMKALGANTVRLYHSLGYKQNQKFETDDEDHKGFLDHAEYLGMHVLPGYHSGGMPCPNFDCYDLWKESTLRGFKQGFATNGTWHKAVAILILMNEPDFLGGQPDCVPKGAAWCRVKAVLSSLDGVLAAEKEAGVTQWGVNFTATWSFGQMTSIDGKVTGPGVFGFQDMVAGIADPGIANYTTRTPQEEMEEAFLTRWTYGLNVQAPYDYVQGVVRAAYTKNEDFGGKPWFIGEDGELWQKPKVIKHSASDAKNDALAGGYFLGMSFFQFETTYWKGGTEMNFGIFGLGNETIGKTPKINGLERNVHCLNPMLTHDGGLNDLNDHRAQPLAEAWGGSLVNITGLCKPAKPTRVVESPVIA